MKEEEELQRILKTICELENISIETLTSKNNNRNVPISILKKIFIFIAKLKFPYIPYTIICSKVGCFSHGVGKKSYNKIAKELENEKSEVSQLYKKVSDVLKVNEFTLTLAIEKVLNTQWTTKTCDHKNCNCGAITPINPIYYYSYGNIKEYGTVIAENTIDQTLAKHIVKLHNAQLKSFEND